VVARAVDPGGGEALGNGGEFRGHAVQTRTGRRNAKGWCGFFLAKKKRGAGSGTV
jgi:hypothetical protein